jgi:biotin transport system substrate-specific component
MADSTSTPCPVPLARLDVRLRAALEVVFFTVFLSFAAQVAVPLPPDGVPQTLHTLVVLLAALRLGPILGTSSMLLYALVGLLGLPVFSKFGHGPAVLVGQTGGYIVGFILCQPVVHWIVRRPDGTVRGWLALVTAMTAAHAVIFAVGVPWLGVVNGFSPSRAVEGGLLPFIPGTIVKTAAAVLIGRYVSPLTWRRAW